MKELNFENPTTIKFQINGRAVQVEVNPKMSLLDVLRNKLGLTGTKRGCNRGDCGACTVIMNGKTVLSCLVPAIQANGKKIETVEGLAKGEKLHPLQKAFIECGAIQCGFCTPGMLLSAKALLDKNSNPTREEVIKAISGNLCRCTGYKKIIDAVMLASQKIAGGGKNGRDRKKNTAD